MSNRLYTRKDQEQDGKTKGWLLWILVTTSLIAIAFIMRWSGSWLVVNDKLGEYSWALVLDGQGRELTRTDAALELLKKGTVDTLVISGARTFKTHYNSEYYLKDLASQEADLNRLIELRHDSYSTIQEAYVSIPYFRELGADTVLLITSNFHTRRAKQVFNALAKGKPYFKVHSVEEPFFHPENWIFEKEAAAIWIVEVLKTISTQYELYSFKDEKLAKADWSNWKTSKLKSYTDQAILDNMVDVESELLKSDTLSQIKDSSLKIIDSLSKALPAFKGKDSL